MRIAVVFRWLCAVVLQQQSRQTLAVSFLHEFAAFTIEAFAQPKIQCYSIETHISGKQWTGKRRWV